MAKRPKRNREDLKQREPLDIFKDYYSYLRNKYKDLTVSEFEYATAWQLLEMDASVNAIAPDNSNEPIDVTIKRFLEVSQGHNNALIRILANAGIIADLIKKQTIAQQAPAPAPACDCQECKEDKE